MYEQLLTEGAHRALEGAANLAAHNRAPSREPRHLLWALMLEESQASEAFRRAGVTCDRLQAAAPLRIPIEIDGDPHPENPADSATFRQILSTAAKAASLRGRGAHIETNDLLAALACVESDASQVLAELGLNSEAIAVAVEVQPAEPIDVNFAIHWRDETGESQSQTLRIIDAAANRAREGLRVLEDYVRFALDDAHFTSRLKGCRHELREALSGLPQADLLRSRETQADVGTAISTPAESIRESLADVAHAAFKRVEEAVRSLEEFGKLFSVTAAKRLERVRYDLYTLEKGLFLTELNRRGLADRRLYLLVSESLCRRGCGSAVRGALAGGVNIVQLREKEMPERRLIDLGRRLREWTRETGALYIMNDRADLAVVTEADGVHVGQDELSVKEARTIVGPHRLIGVSTHTIEQARQAVLDGADYIGVGPVFPSATKSFESLAGLELVRQVAAEIALPWFAIGGINLESLPAVLETGARRIAVSHAILSADDSELAARKLRDALIL